MNDTFIKRIIAKRAFLLPGECSQQKWRKVVTAGVVLGLIGIVGWFIPLVGFPVTIVGLIRGKSDS